MEEKSCEKSSHGNEQGFKKYLYNEVTAIVAVVGVVVGVMNWVNNPMAKVQTDIALIKQSIVTIETNHLTHIQAALEEHKQDEKLQAEEVEKLKEQYSELDKKLERILTKLE
jgi:uncharacterized membrane protein